jgi:hypothetical protein
MPGPYRRRGEQKKVKTRRRERGTTRRMRLMVVDGGWMPIKPQQTDRQTGNEYIDER